MALEVGDRPIRPLTADEVARMVEMGILSEDEPVELLHGVLTEVSPKSPAHEEVKLRLTRWLAPLVVAGRHDVRFEGPLVVPDRTSLPEPDLAVVGREHDSRRHPSTALLVIEIAVTSVKTDMTLKPALYAAAGVPELWVVDVPARRLRIFSRPRGHGYASVTDAGPHDVAQPRAIDAEPLDLSGLFAGL